MDAVQYGNGESEKNLGRVLQKLKPANVAVGTKVRLPPSEFDRIADAVTMSLEGSLARLRLDRVDIFHLHNAITETEGEMALSVRASSDFSSTYMLDVRLVAFPSRPGTRVRAWMRPPRFRAKNFSTCTRSPTARGSSHASQYVMGRCCLLFLRTRSAPRN
jgi:hypothetical protein